MPKEELLQLSVCDICNLDCIFCSQHETLYGMEKKGIQPSSKMIEVERLDEFLKNFKGKKYSTLSLVSSGEFFVHPRWDDILEKVFKFNFQEKVADIIVINSNGTLLTTNKIDIIFNLLQKYPVRFKFVFSINANTSDTYKNLTGKELFSDVQLNAGYFLQKTVDFNKKDTEQCVYFSVQFLVVNENQKELRPFVDFWKEKFETLELDYEVKLYCENINKKYSIVIRKAFLPKQKEADELFEQTLLEAGISCDAAIFKDSSDGLDLSGDDASLVSRFKSPCIALWKYPYVSTDGKITICCRDVSFKYSYGEIKDGKSIEEVMNESPELRNFKDIHVQGHWEKMPLCFRCSGYERDDKDSSEWKHILEKDDPDMWSDYKFRMKKGVCFDYYHASFNTSVDILKDYLEYTDKRVDRLISSETHDKSLFRRNSENIEYEHWGINPSYPCVYWFRCLKEKDGELFTGCDRVDVPISIHDLFKNELLNGDLAELPEECRNCRERPKIDEKDIIYLCPERFDEFSLVIGEKKIKEAQDLYDKKELEKFLKENKNRKLNEYLWEKVFNVENISSYPFEFLYDYFSDDAYSLFSLLRAYPQENVEYIEGITKRLKTGEAYFRFITALLEKKDHLRLFKLFKEMDILSYTDSKYLEVEKVFLLTSLSLADSFDIQGLRYLFSEYGESFEIPEKIFNVLYQAVLIKKLSLKETLTFVDEFFKERIDDVLSYLSVDLIKLDYSNRIWFIKRFKEHPVVKENEESYSHTLFVKKYYYSLYLLLGEKALEYIERAKNDRYFRIVCAEYIRNKNIKIVERAWRIAQENDCKKAALYLYTICFKHDQYDYLDKYRFMLYFLEENGEFGKALRINMSTLFKHPIFFIKKSINLVMYMTGIKRRSKE